MVQPKCGAILVALSRVHGQYRRKEPLRRQHLFRGTSTVGIVTRIGQRLTQLAALEAGSATLACAMLFVLKLGLSLTLNKCLVQKV